MSTRTRPTPGAMKAAEIILDGNEHIPTLYGGKTQQGIADLIDRETQAPALLNLCRAVLEDWQSHPSNFDKAEPYYVKEARALLAQIEE